MTEEEIRVKSCGVKLKELNDTVEKLSKALSKACMINEDALLKAFYRLANMNSKRELPIIYRGGGKP